MRKGISVLILTLTMSLLVLTSIVRGKPDDALPISFVNSGLCESIQGIRSSPRHEANQLFAFLSYVMEPGDRRGVYTNEDHPEWCGFSYGSGSAIWSNSRCLQSALEKKAGRFYALQHLLWRQACCSLLWEGWHGWSASQTRPLPKRLSHRCCSTDSCTSTGSEPGWGSS